MINEQLEYTYKSKLANEARRSESKEDLTIAKPLA